MAARAKKMPDAVARGREGRNRDDRCAHSYTPLKLLASIDPIGSVGLLA
jgi:hypothetical protein